MKVAIVGWGYDAAVADEQALLECYDTLTGWCDALRTAGASRVSVVQRFRRTTTVTRGGVDYYFCRDGADGRLPFGTASPSMAARIAALDADVVHVNGLGFEMQTWWLRQRLPERPALVVQDHASGPAPAAATWAGRARQALRRRAMRAPDAFLFTAAAQADPWIAARLIGRDQRVWAVHEASTRIEPIGIDDARRLTGIGGVPAILWVGRLNANKDPLCVLDAFSRLQAGWPRATLTMLFGEADLLAEVQRRVHRDAALTAAVRLVGAVPHHEVARYYSAADLFVLGSHHESCGYAVLEACACGVPPAVTDIPSFRMLTGEGEVGRLWPAGDAAACAAALDSLARSVGPQQRARVRAHFQHALSWPAVGRSALIAYDAIADDRRRRRR